MTQGRPHITNIRTGRKRIKRVANKARQQPHFLEYNHLLKRIHSGSIGACLLSQSRLVCPIFQKILVVACRHQVSQVPQPNCYGKLGNLTSTRCTMAWSPGNQLLRYPAQATCIQHCITPSSCSSSPPPAGNACIWGAAPSPHPPSGSVRRYRSRLMQRVLSIQ